MPHTQLYGLKKLKVSCAPCNIKDQVFNCTMIYLHFDPSESSHLTNKCTSHITQHLTRVFTRFFHNTTEIVLYELFSSESNRDSGRMDSIKLLPLSDFKKSALLSTFDVDTKGKDGGVMFARYNYPHSMFTL